MIKVSNLDESKELTRQWLETLWNEKQGETVVYVTQEYYNILKERYNKDNKVEEK